MIRYAIEDIKSQITTFALFGEKSTIHLIFIRHSSQTQIHRSQGGHKETVLIDSARIEIHQTIQSRPTVFINGIIFGIDTMQQTLQKRNKNAHRGGGEIEIELIKIINKTFIFISYFNSQVIVGKLHLFIHLFVKCCVNKYLFFCK